MLYCMHRIRLRIWLSKRVNFKAGAPAPWGIHTWKVHIYLQTMIQEACWNIYKRMYRLGPDVSTGFCCLNFDGFKQQVRSPIWQTLFVTTRRKKLWNLPQADGRTKAERQIGLVPVAHGNNTGLTTQRNPGPLFVRFKAVQLPPPWVLMSLTQMFLAKELFLCARLVTILGLRSIWMGVSPWWRLTKQIRAVKYQPSLCRMAYLGVKP